ESIAENIKDKSPAKRKSSSTKADAPPKSEKQSSSSDLVNEGLYNILRDWRRLEAEDRGLPAFGILSNRALMEIQAKLPTSESELKKISGVGVIKLKQFGEAVLTIVRDYCYDNDL
ncbi:MAG: HRDC domain-containing protein, partial [Rikenellaceae bacterium]